MKAQSVEAGTEEYYTKSSTKGTSVSKALCVLDFILRVAAAVGTLASALAMGTTKQTLPFASRFVRFKAVYKDLPTFTFFVMANSIVCGYLLVSLCVSFLHILKSSAIKSRIMLLICDMVMMALLMSGASAASSIVYIAHYGNSSANWAAFCPQFNSFCQRISGSLIGSFLSVLILVFIIVLTSISISRR